MGFSTPRHEEHQDSLRCCLALLSVPSWCLGALVVNLSRKPSCFFVPFASWWLGPLNCAVAVADVILELVPEKPEAAQHRIYGGITQGAQCLAAANVAAEVQYKVNIPFTTVSVD